MSLWGNRVGADRHSARAGSDMVATVNYHSSGSLKRRWGLSPRGFLLAKSAAVLGFDS